LLPHTHWQSQWHTVRPALTLFPHGRFSLAQAFMPGTTGESTILLPAPFTGLYLFRGFSHRQFQAAKASLSVSPLKRAENILSFPRDPQA
jgi:hypothetical protein